MANPFPERGVGPWQYRVIDPPNSSVEDLIFEVIGGFHTTLDEGVQRDGFEVSESGVWSPEPSVAHAFSFFSMVSPNQAAVHDPSYPDHTVTFTFSDDPLPGGPEEELAYTSGSGFNYEVILKDDLHLLNRGPGANPQFGGPNLVRDVVAHELGHVILSYVVEAYGASAITALCDMFGAPESAWDSGAWRTQVKEAVCETFKDSILKLSFGRWNNVRDNRTDWHLPEDQWDNWLDVMFKAPKRYDAGGRYDVLYHGMEGTWIPFPPAKGLTYSEDDDYPQMLDMVAQQGIVFDAVMGKPEGPLDIAWDWSGWTDYRPDITPWEVTDPHYAYWPSFELKLAWYDGAPPSGFVTHSGLDLTAFVQMDVYEYHANPEDSGPSHGTYHPDGAFEITPDVPVVASDDLGLIASLSARNFPKQLFTDPPTGDAGITPSYMHNWPRLPWDWTEIRQQSWQAPTWPYSDLPPLVPIVATLNLGGPSAAEVREKNRVIALAHQELRASKLLLENANEILFGNKN